MCVFSSFHRNSVIPVWLREPKVPPSRAIHKGLHAKVTDNGSIGIRVYYSPPLLPLTPLPRRSSLSRSIIPSLLTHERLVVITVYCLDAQVFMWVDSRPCTSIQTLATPSLTDFVRMDEKCRLKNEKNIQ